MNYTEMLACDYYKKHDSDAGFTYLAHKVPDEIIPNDPSVVLEFLADSLLRLLPDPNMVLDMRKWHCPSVRHKGNYHCDLAGVYMIDNLKAPTSFDGVRIPVFKGRQITPSLYSPKIRDVLQGIDRFGMGDPIDLVAVTMQLEIPDVLYAPFFTKYDAAYKARWKFSHAQDACYFHNFVLKKDIRGLIDRIRWAARWIEDDLRANPLIS